jgi:hypothetical protein
MEHDRFDRWLLVISMSVFKSISLLLNCDRKDLDV